jgi:hypothetical protein
VSAVADLGKDAGFRMRHPQLLDLQAPARRLDHERAEMLRHALLDGLRWGAFVAPPPMTQAPSRAPDRNAQKDPAARQGRGRVHLSGKRDVGRIYRVSAGTTVAHF